MGRPLILETSYLIDLERELRRGRPGAAVELLEREVDSPLYVTFTIAGELAAGLSLDQRPRWEEFLAPFRVLPASIDVCWRYGEIYRHLQRAGTAIGSNDLWIAATAVAHEMPIVTRNDEHFSRVPGLEIVAYGR